LVIIGHAYIVVLPAELHKPWAACFNVRYQADR